MDIKSFKAGLKLKKELVLVGPMCRSVPAELMKLPQIFVDGGTQVKKKNPLHLSVGDGDSAGRRLDVMVDGKKDYSDLKLALSFVPKKKIHTLHMVGFLGGRHDHELLNLGEIHHFLGPKKQWKIHFWTKQKITIMGLSRGQYQFNYTGIFSLISFASTKVNLKGKCEYPLKNKILKNVSSLGLSNVAFGKVEVKTQKPVFVFFSKEKVVGKR